MRLAHCQCEIAVGDIPANTERILAEAERAAARGIDLLTFPESMLTGYFDHESDARQHSMALDDARLTGILQRTAKSGVTVVFGLNERRGGELFNSVVVCRSGEVLGVYAKAFPCFSYFTPGRDFPVFEVGGITFGVIICADGSFIEPSRILALKGAQLIVAPHNNYIMDAAVLDHYQFVRADHVSRACENAVYFLRGNNVVSGRDKGMHYDGTGYGDSYLMDPVGQVLVQSQRKAECVIEYELDPAQLERSRNAFVSDRSRQSARALNAIYQRTLAEFGEG